MAHWHHKNTPGTSLQPWLKKSLGVTLTCALIVCFHLSSIAQTNRYLQQGNKYYEQQKYKEAAADYAKALKNDPNNTSGLFNLGNSLYQQQNFDSSRKIMSATEKMIKDKKGKAATDYNIGNTYMAQKKWDDAINAYKQTLRANPQDVDAKYNLSYAEEMQKKQQDQNKQNQQNKNQQNKQQQNKDQQNKDQQNKDKQNQDKQNQDQKDQQNKDQQQPQGQPSKISQQDAENLLNALQQQEKKLQDKMNKEKGAPTRLEKDW